MAKAPVRRLTARRTASSSEMAGCAGVLAESARTAWDSLASRVRLGVWGWWGGGLEFILNDVGDDFGVGFRLEDVALGDERVLEREVVLDDAVVHDDERSGAVAVRGWAFSSVGRPWVAQRVWPMPKVPWMGDFSMTASRLRSLPGRAAEFELGRAAADGDAGGVVAAVFEAAKTFNDDGDD